ncbi:MAG: hypothetical protein B6D44_06980 [Ignavibacteriales bacterium UTCHB2]|nr:MAG: hypothetical protein B6D44_06980 [Ignavibacteriales bacterium UTCHB2]
MIWIKRFFIFSMFIFYAIFSINLVAQDVTYTPKWGSEERKIILDALRHKIEPSLNTNVVFEVAFFKVRGDWAFMRGYPTQANGQKIDYSKTKYEELIKEGMFDNNICALLFRKDGVWLVTQYVLGATDVPYEGWYREYNAPKEIFDNAD